MSNDILSGAWSLFKDMSATLAKLSAEMNAIKEELEGKSDKELAKILVTKGGFFAPANLNKQKKIAVYLLKSRGYTSKEQVRNLLI